MEGVRTTCAICNGSQFKEEVLQYQLAGYNIVEVLKMTVNDALTFLKTIKSKRLWGL